MSTFDRKDVYTRVTERIISDLEQGVRTWMKPWSAEHAAGLWGEATAKGYVTPIWDAAFTRAVAARTMGVALQDR